MEIKEVKNKDEWEGFLKKCYPKTFLQSWNWGEFNKAMGNKIWRLGIYKPELVGVALVIKIVARRGSFLFVPHGPIIRSQNSNLSIQEGFRIAKIAQSEETKFKIDILKELLERLKEIAKKEKADFIRVASIFQRTERNKEIFKNLGFREAPIHIHPEVTWILNIVPPEQEILMKMRKSTRNLIRRAKKEGIEVFQENSIRGVKKFNEIYRATFDRHHFVPFSFEYLKSEFLTFFADNQVAIFFAKYQSKILASAMIIFWQQIGFYHQGASLVSKIPAPYFLQWQAIREAKRRGCKLYNFWGIAPEIKCHKDLKNPKIKKHPWWGLSLFKMGFGGFREEYLKTQDYVLSKRYWFSFAVEKIRKIKRGY